MEDVVREIKAQSIKPFDDKVSQRKLELAKAEEALLLASNQWFEAHSRLSDLESEYLPITNAIAQLKTQLNQKKVDKNKLKADLENREKEKRQVEPGLNTAKNDEKTKKDKFDKQSAAAKEMLKKLEDAKKERDVFLDKPNVKSELSRYEFRIDFRKPKN